MMVNGSDKIIGGHARSKQRLQEVDGATNQLEPPIDGGKGYGHGVGKSRHQWKHF